MMLRILEIPNLHLWQGLVLKLEFKQKGNGNDKAAEGRFDSQQLSTKAILRWMWTMTGYYFKNIILKSSEVQTKW